MMLAKIVKRLLPFAIVNRLRTIKAWLLALYYHGSTYQCPICGNSFRQFGAAGNAAYIRDNARCPKCNSVERHRIIWLYISRETDCLKRETRMLHFAPEKCFYDKFKSLDTLQYVNGDIEKSCGDIELDITAISQPKANFDLVLCNHVLEHIPDDAKAIKELYRVTRPGGTLIVTVPIKGDTTFETTDTLTDEERLDKFGQIDHVRMYGLDIAERLEKAGFVVEVLNFLEKISEEYILKHRLKIENSQYDDVDHLFICRKV